jgi:hypothetical protein
MRAGLAALTAIDNNHPGSADRDLLLEQGLLARAKATPRRLRFSWSAISSKSWEPRSDCSEIRKMRAMLLRKVLPSSIVGRINIKI